MINSMPATETTGRDIGCKGPEVHRQLEESMIIRRLTDLTTQKNEKL